MSVNYANVNNGIPQDPVNNIGIDTGNYVDISYNFLDLTPEGTDMTNITILLSRGVDLAYEPQK